ncbi:hypothetical protein ES319_D12G247200v1 [Gossypium barbadense]|uniref:MACPF domain-containing protein n=1 Tax=Gossypium barbadense TaxID=3634 RepID=A0A5J5P2K7_GOSBA|nr:hypothetical protein ES319_D12G247200v1 [Gossypium barbadense]KAB2000657.1 hypothetical protein ES319_D12G247200v1 [Gossypium barbadense]
MRYIAELERKVQTLQTEATPLSAQLTLVQRDTNGLTAENSELKLRLQAMEQQVHLQDGERLSKTFRFIQTYGTHIIVGMAIGGQDLMCQAKLFLYNSYIRA